MKLLIQMVAGRFGYFIIKKRTLDKLTNELAETKAQLAQTKAEIAQTKAETKALREQNRALLGERKLLRTRLADNP